LWDGNYRYGIFKNGIKECWINDEHILAKAKIEIENSKNINPS